MIKKIISIFALIFLIVSWALPGSPLNLFRNPNTVLAIGDLTVTWGEPEGDPIFVINNFAPGTFESRTVGVSNGAVVPRPVGIKAIKKSGLGSLENVLQVVISKGGVDLYGGTSPTGPKTLAQFFAESAGADDFIALTTLTPGGSANYLIKVVFDSSAGNEFQSTSIVFDLKIGVAIKTPDECQKMTFNNPIPIFGTSGNDRLNGTSGSDLIFALEGNDRVFGGGGNDCIVGNEGNDSLYGELGDDFILGGEGNNLLVGAAGNDSIFGGDDHDTIRGEVGDDKLYGMGGNDEIKGGAGNDYIRGGLGNDTINGEAGADDVNGQEQNDNIRGGSGGDLLLGGDGTDITNGEAGADTCDAEIEISCEL